MSFVVDVHSGRRVNTHTLLRRIRSRQAYEVVQPPEPIRPGEPVPSIEGWVLLLSNLPTYTQVTHIRNLLASFDPDPEYFGNVNEVKLPIDDYDQCAGWALVELDSKQGFDRAIEALNGCRFSMEDGSVVHAHGESGDGDAGALQTASPPIAVAPAFIAEEEGANERDETRGAEEEEDGPGMKRTRGDTMGSTGTVSGPLETVTEEEEENKVNRASLEAVPVAQESGNEKDEQEQAPQEVKRRIEEEES